MARQNGSAIRHAQPKHTAQPYWPLTPPQSGLYMPMAGPSDEANAEANVCACVTFVAATEAGIPSFAASGGAEAEAEDEAAADAETEAVAEIARAPSRSVCARTSRRTTSGSASAAHTRC